ncbi:UNVERIFIED_CONTAM: hypothetical protein K2H54_004353, partial [Gekko kuhli]
LPGQLLCNLEPEAVSPLGQNDALTLAERISKNCVITHKKCLTTGEKGMLPFQVAVSLVSKFDEFSPEILTSLGQGAVGLSVPQIESQIRDQDLLASLPSLSKVRGWNAQQAGAILSKLFHSGYQIQDGRSLAALGSLVAGMEVDRLQEVLPDVVLDALQVPGFATQLEHLSPAQKTVFVHKRSGKNTGSTSQTCWDGSHGLREGGRSVANLHLGTCRKETPESYQQSGQKEGFNSGRSSSSNLSSVFQLIAATGGFKDLMKHVPDELVPYIPKSQLVPVGEFSIQYLNGKSWTQEQATVFFDDVIRTVHDFSSLCASILQGFTCAAASNLDTERLRELAKAMKEKKVQLGKDQLLCLADRLVLHGVPHDFNEYPEDLVLFVSPSDYGAIGSCKEYFAHVGKANVDVLEKGLSQRKQLLAEALDCLKISGPHVSWENAEILGRLACDLSAEYFKTSGKNLLKQLTQCHSFSPNQVKAIQALLCSGNTPLGPPAEWTPSTLEELSGLFHVFDLCILQKIPVSVLVPQLKCLLHKSHLHRKDLAAFVKSLRSPRQKRSSESECPPGKEATDKKIEEETLPIDYESVEEFRACLGNEILLRNLSDLSHLPFTDEQMAVIKEKLDGIYPDGYPDSVVRNLGDFMTLMGPEDMKKWRFNSSKTLAAVLVNDLSPEVATAIIRQYTDNGGPLNAEALDAIGTKYICLLEPDQLKKIDENAIKAANPLDLSSCNQNTKDILYRKAKRACSDRHNPPQYYECIKPYVGAAPVEDLRALTKDNVNMDIYTFMNLTKDAIWRLTPSEVKGLLGKNLPEMKDQQDKSPIKEWIAIQPKSELKRLGFGVNGGTPKGYINITPRNNRPPEKSGATSSLTLHLFPSLLLTLLLTAFLS